MSTDAPTPRGSTESDSDPSRTSELADVTVVHNAEQRRYEIRSGETILGFTEYREPGDGRRVFVHTEVDPAYAGHGLAGRLVGDALDDVRAAGERIVPICPYVAKYVTTHRQYDDIIDWPPVRA